MVFSTCILEISSAFKLQSLCLTMIIYTCRCSQPAGGYLLLRYKLGDPVQICTNQLSSLCTPHPIPPSSFLLCLTGLASDEDVTLHIQKDGGKPTPFSRGERASVASPKVYAGYSAARQSHDTGQNRSILSRGANQSAHNILLELKMDLFQTPTALYKFVKKRHLQGILP